VIASLKDFRQTFLMIFYATRLFNRSTEGSKILKDTRTQIKNFEKNS